MDRGYDPESLKAEAEKLSMTNDPNARGARNSIEKVTKEIDALHHVVDGLSEVLSSALVPEGMRITAEAITMDRIGEKAASSPLVDEIEQVRARARNARLRLQSIMERIDL